MVKFGSAIYYQPRTRTRFAPRSKGMKCSDTATPAFQGGWCLACEREQMSADLPLDGQTQTMRLSADAVPGLISAYYTEEVAGTVTFGTSGHRGSSLRGTFNEAHVAAICQAVSDLRPASGPMYLGKDTHALAEPACRTALEIFAANEVDIVLGEGYVPTPVLSHAVLTYNSGRTSGKADAVLFTPSHNPPEDGGFKYNPPSGGPAPAALTNAIQLRARELLAANLKGVRRVSLTRALNARTTTVMDLADAYVADLGAVLDLKAVANAGIRIGVDPMGGAAVHYWHRIAECYGLDLEVVNPDVDPAFGFMPLDHDGRVRMDCSSSHAMRNLIGLQDRFDIAFGNDPDVDRHGIITPSSGLMNPNHYLAVAGAYLFGHRPAWPAKATFAKTVVTSIMIDRIAQSLERSVLEVPVGFKWFVDALLASECGLAGEESAGATFLRRDGTVWTTDKDGIVMGLLAAEILATTGQDPGEHYRTLEERFGRAVYRRVDADATPAQKAVLGQLSPDAVRASTLAGEPILARLTRAPGNGAAIGGLKVVTDNGWFAARPSGTEDIYKVYAESLKGEDHLALLIEEAQSIVSVALESR